METITILIKEVPHGNVILMKDTYIRMEPRKAYPLVEQGYAIGYNPDTKQQFYPFLSDEYPQREKLFKKGIYTENQLKPRLGVASEIDGIGEKTIKKYEELLGLREEVKEKDEETDKTDEVASDLESFIKEDEEE